MADPSPTNQRDSSGRIPKLLFRRTKRLLQSQPARRVWNMTCDLGQQTASTLAKRLEDAAEPRRRVSDQTIHGRINMQLKDVMTTHVQGISADQSVREAAEAMGRLQVGAIPIFRDNQPIGIVTDRDIAIRAVAAGCDCSSKPVSEIMTSELYTMPETALVVEAANRMQEHQIRRLLVTGADSDEIVGIVALGDIAAKSDQQELCGKLIEQVSQPAEPARH